MVDFGLRDNKDFVDVLDKIQEMVWSWVQMSKFDMYQSSKVSHLNLGHILRKGVL